MNNLLKTKQLSLYYNNKNNKKKNSKKKKEKLEEKVSQFLRSRKQKKMKELVGIVGPGKIDTGIRKWK